MSGATHYLNIEKGSSFVSSRGDLSDDELLFIARHHYRGASGQAIARMLNRPVPTVNAVRERLDPIRGGYEPASKEETTYSVAVIAVPPEPAKTMATISEEIAGYYQVQLGDLRGPSRLKVYVEARQAAFWACYEHKRPDATHRYSTPQIGEYFGGRDHSTVLHGIRQHEKRLALAAREAA